MRKKEKTLQNSTENVEFPSNIDSIETTNKHKKKGLFSFALFKENVKSYWGSWSIVSLGNAILIIIVVMILSSLNINETKKAMTLATKICLINNGVLQQYEPPLKVYSTPNNLFVADFVGNPTMNFIPATITKVEPKTFTVNFFGVNATFKSEEDFELPNTDENNVEKVVIGIRPEFLKISENGKITGTAYSTLPSGMETVVKINLNGDILSAVQFGLIDYPTDSVINFDVTGKHILIFDEASSNRLGIGELIVK